MSFQNASLPISRFVPNWAKTNRYYEATKAVIDASNLNRNITVQDLGTQLGKLRMFKLNYYPIVCDAEGDCADNICSPGERLEPKQAFFQLTKCTASKVFELDASDIRLIDDGGMSFSDHAKSQIASTMPAMRKVLDEQILAILIANVGLLPDGNPSLQVNLTDVNGAPNPAGMWQIEKEFADAGFENPFIIGGNQAFFLERSRQIAGLAANGLNLGQSPMGRTYYDPLLNPAFGDNKDHLIAFDPTVLKFITWSENAGIFATDLTSINDLDKLFSRGINSSIKGSLLDPVYPLLWDLNIKFDDCKNVWTYQYKLHWDIFFLPDMVCNVQGVNGIFGFTTCPPVVLPCPTGTPVPPPATTRTFSWTPTLTFPLQLTTMTIGSITNKPGYAVNNLTDLVAAMNDMASGVSFDLNAGKIEYTGLTSIPGNINGSVNMNFA